LKTPLVAVQQQRASASAALIILDLSFALSASWTVVLTAQNVLLERFFTESVMEVLLLIAQDAHRCVPRREIEGIEQTIRLLCT
jgi:hypothetical protein